MGIAENKALVLDFMAHLGSDAPKWDLLDDNAVWWIQGRGEMGKAEFQQVAGGIKHIAVASQMFINHVTAEDDRVAIESRSEIEMKDGRTFRNTYHFLFIVRDGRIVGAREHFDTGYARDFFGAAQDAILEAAKGQAA